MSINMQEVYSVVSCQESPNRNANVLALDPMECKWWSATIVNIKEKMTSQFSDKVCENHNEAFSKSQLISPTSPNTRKLFEDEVVTPVKCYAITKESGHGGGLRGSEWASRGKGAGKASRFGKDGKQSRPGGAGGLEDSSEGMGKTEGMGKKTIGSKEANEEALRKKCKANKADKAICHKLKEEQNLIEMKKGTCKKEDVKLPEKKAGSLFLTPEGKVEEAAGGLKVCAQRPKKCNCKSPCLCNFISEYMNILEHKVTFYAGSTTAAGPSTLPKKPKIYFSAPDISLPSQKTPETKKVKDIKKCVLDNLKENTPFNYEKNPEELTFPRLSKSNQDTKVRDTKPKTSLPNLLVNDEDDKNFHTLINKMRKLLPHSSFIRSIDPCVIKYYRPLAKIPFPVDVETMASKFLKLQ